jgi:peptidoglycan/LPS O-acetylase OafA/YrhL
MTDARLATLSAGRDNNLNLIRMIAATAVLVSHSYPVTLGPTIPEPLEPLLGKSLGALAVIVFFAISGFLITRSFDRGASVGHWLRSRVLRLFPGLAVVLVITVALLGPAVTTLPLSVYTADPQTLSYVPRNLSLAFLQFGLPGVFEHNPFGGGINGSLWSLFHEVLCYFGVLIAGLAGLLGNRRRAVLAFGGYFALYLLGDPAILGAALPGKAAVFRDLSLPFALGAAAYVWRDAIALRWSVVLIGAVLTALLRPTPMFADALTIWIAYSILCLAYLPGGAVRAYNRLGDYSYGVYIYAFPCQQLAQHLFGPMTPLTNIALAAPVTLLCAILSWHFVEGPALRLARGPKAAT